MIFRPLNFEDSAEVRAVARLHVISPREWDADHEISEEGIDDYAKWMGKKKNQMWCEIALMGGEIKAMHLLTHNDTKTTASILSLWVSEDSRRQGMASRLKLAGEDWVKSLGIRKLTTGVYLSNEKMRALNEKLGFKPVKLEYEKLLI